MVRIVDIKKRKAGEKMAVRLSKGQKVDLTKGNPNLKEIIVGLGWASNSSGNSNDFDLDASAFLIGQNGKVKDENDLVFYNNPLGGQGSVKHSGDKKKGSGEGDDEQIHIVLTAVPGYIERIAFTITINDAQAKRQSFGDIRNAYVRIINPSTNDLLLKYELGQEFSIETAIVAAEIYRHAGEWKFSAIGSGFQGGLAALCNNFGLEVEEEQRSAAPYGGSQNGQTNNQSYGQNNNQSYSQNNPQSYGQNSNQSYSPSMPQTYGQNNNQSYSQSPVPAYEQSNYQPAGQGGVFCPRCNSIQVTAGKKGFGIGKALVGGVMLGPVGILAGFIGSKNMEFACLSCKERWGATSNTNTVQWLQRQTDSAKSVVNKYMGKDLMEALVAGSALVATADGIIDRSEREKLIDYFRTSQEMKGINNNEVDSRFNYYVQRIQSDRMMGKAEALRAVGKISSKPEVARLVVRLCCAIGFADGEFAPVEKQVVEEICREVRLDPREFLY